MRKILVVRPLSLSILTASFCITFWLLIFNMACKEGNIIENEILDYSIVKKIDVPIGSKNYNYSSMELIENADDWLLYGFDQENYDLTVLNLTQENAAYQIKYKKEGPNALNAARAMYVHRTDSIFFLNDLNEVYLFNAKAERLDYWKIETPIPKNYFLSWKPEYADYTFFAINKPDMLSMEFVYLPQNQSIISNLMILPSYSLASDYRHQSKLPILFEIQLNTGKFIDYAPNFNAQDEDINLNMIYPFVTSTDGIEMVGMNYTSKVYNKKLDTVFNITSNNSTSKITSFKPTQEFDLGQDVKAYTQDEAYLGVYYDKYRKVYYRVFQQALSSSGGELEQKIQANWSLIVFKNNGEIIGEVNFPKEKYNFLEIFVMPEGVLLFKENSYDKQNKEDILSFDLITINYE